MLRFWIKPPGRPNKNGQALKFGILGSVSSGRPYYHTDVKVDAIACDNRHTCQEWCRRALAKGKHVLLDTPGTGNAADAERLFSWIFLGSTNCPVLLECTSYRFHPSWLEFERAIKRPSVVQAKVLVALPAAYDEDKNLQFCLEHPGRVKLDMGMPPDTHTTTFLAVLGREYRQDEGHGGTLEVTRTVMLRYRNGPPSRHRLTIEEEAILCNREMGQILDAFVNRGGQHRAAVPRTFLLKDAQLTPQELERVAPSASRAESSGQAGGQAKSRQPQEFVHMGELIRLDQRASAQTGNRVGLQSSGRSWEFIHAWLDTPSVRGKYEETLTGSSKSSYTPSWQDDGTRFSSALAHESLPSSNRGTRSHQGSPTTGIISPLTAISPRTRIRSESALDSGIPSLKAAQSRSTPQHPQGQSSGDDEDEGAVELSRMPNMEAAWPLSDAHPSIPPGPPKLRTPSSMTRSRQRRPAGRQGREGRHD
ncbi:hypothetical protein VTH82DRAFT_7369 [Thermothelomyces myriococcoides]